MATGDYSVTCQDLNVLDIYDAMILDGFTNEKFDIGHGVLTRNKDGKIVRKTVGAGDLEIPCEEILEPGVDRYEKYHPQLKALTGRAFPMLLDDFDPSTTFDEKLRTEISTAINKAEEILAKSNVTTQSPLYKKKKAMALYYFAHLPDQKILKEWQNRAPYKIYLLTGELYQNGLGEFSDWIVENGGLGFSNMDRDLKFEGTALKSSKKHKGLCTEKGKMFYPILKMAGLEPRIVFMKAKDVFDVWNKEMLGSKGALKIDPSEEFSGHVVVALDVGEKNPLFFEFQAQMPALDAPYGDIAVPITLREFYQLDLLNLELDYGQARDFGKAKLAWWGADKLGDSFVTAKIIVQSGALLLYAGEKIKDVFPIFEKAFKVDSMDEYVKSKYCDALFGMGKANDAISCFREMAPNVVNAEYQLGEALTASGKYAEGREVLLKMSKLEIGGARTYSLIGDTYFNEGTFDKAEEYYRKAITGEPFEKMYHRNLVLTLEKQGKKGEALEALKKVVILNPNEVDYYGQLIKRLVSSNRFDEAMAYFDQVLMVVEGHCIEKGVDACVILTKPVWPIAKGAKGWNEFLSFFERLETYYNQHGTNLTAVWYICRITTLVKSGKFESAIIEAEKAIQMFPEKETAEIMWLKGKAYEEMGNVDKAIDCYRKTIVAEPARAEAYFDLANLLERQEKYSEVIELLSQLISSHGMVFGVGPFVLLARSFWKIGNKEAAIFALSKTSTFKIWQTLASSVFLEDFADPKEVFLIGMLQDKDAGNAVSDFYVNWGFSYLYRKDSDVDQTSSFFKLALELNPNNDKAVFGLAEVYYLSDNFEKAAESYGLSAKMVLDSTQVLDINIGMRWLFSAWKSKRDINSAMEYINRFLTFETPERSDKFAEHVAKLNENVDQLPDDLLKMDQLRNTLVKLYRRYKDVAHELYDDDTSKECYERALKFK